MPLHLHRSNRTEALVDGLTAVLRTPLDDPLTPECIVVQGGGMERWLSMQLADRLGAWANPEFPFPRRAIARMLAACLHLPESGAEAFELPTLTWAVAALLPAHLDHPAFAPIRRYVVVDPTGMRLVELAERIAATFDRYLVYRPMLIQAWERGRDADWQALLWRALVARHGNDHLAARAAALIRRAPTYARETVPGQLPARISLFGVSSLPPLYLEILTTIAQEIDVHLFVLSPSGEYWGDIRSRREIVRELDAQAVDGTDIDLLHLSEGHPLVASLARLGRDFLQLIEEAGGYIEAPRSHYVDPGHASMLLTLQADMLALRQPGTDEHPRHPISATDDSIAVHTCHGAMREVEVIHDQLLALFDADPTLQPHDVLVMCPALDEYAPYIDAVFGAGHDGRPAFRYRVADRAVRASDTTYDAFCRTLDVLGGRVTASEVIDLLELEPIRRRAGLAAGDLELVRRWIQDAGIRWGVDEHHRLALGYPPIRETTWRFGLDRLLLGCSMRGGGTTLFGDVLPVDDIDGSESTILGRATTFCERLFALRDRLATPRPMGRWAAELDDALDMLLDPAPDDADEAIRIRHALEGLSAGAMQVDFDAPVALDVARLALDRALRDRNAPLGFLGGGITCCAMVPMRSIPFRVIVLLGLNDETFPRVERTLGFDRTTEEHRLGDRSTRDDDRYTFLEALLSARERVIITYVGQSIRDNMLHPPSVVVSELLDVLDASFAPPSGTAREHVLVQHRLQPFSPAYFRDDGTPLFSYARGACAGATRMLEPPIEPTPLVPHPLPARQPSPVECSLDAFTAFLEHPIRGFLQQQLGLLLGRDLMVLDDREPVTLEALDEWSVGHALLDRAVQHDPARRATSDAALAAVRATGALPPGNLGALYLGEIVPQVQALAAHVARLRAGDALAPLEIDTRVGDVHLTGVLEGLWPAAQLHHQYSKLGRRSELRLWIRHLLLLLVAPAAYPQTTVIVGRDATRRPALCRFGSVPDPRAELTRLAGLFVEGQSEPLVWFPSASRAYAEMLHEQGPGTHDRALTRARSVFSGGEGRVFGDRDDPYVRQLYLDRNPFDPPSPAFAATALAVFGPLLQHRELDA